jgi:nitroimidazol reductase NimA-like FMN-containing flavoprotein (pyridoxamine 5'-phosphate oxidase superfamily)
VPKLDLSMTAEELEDYLRTQRTIRLATNGRAWPQVIPLWFVWVDQTLFMNSTLGNVSIENLHRDPRATGTVDDGDVYDELRGVLIQGEVEWADGDPRLEAVKRTWSEKYMGGNPVPYDRWKNRVWFRLVPRSLTSWNFRKIPAAKARAKAAAEAGARAESEEVVGDA